jgi:hypothetical protein
MGYFSNGCEGYDYQENYCSRCVHHPQTRDDPSCPVWMAHYLEAYSVDNVKEKPLGRVLNLLIPREKGGLNNLECAMFVPLGLPSLSPRTEPDSTDRGAK